MNEWMNYFYFIFQWPRPVEESRCWLCKGWIRLGRRIGIGLQKPGRLQTALLYMPLHLRRDDEGSQNRQPLRWKTVWKRRKWERNFSTKSCTHPTFLEKTFPNMFARNKTCKKSHLGRPTPSIKPIRLPSFVVVVVKPKVSLWKQTGNSSIRLRTYIKKGWSLFYPQAPQTF